MAGPMVFKSKVFVTEPFRAVFPDLNKADRFDTYKVDVDTTTEVGERIEATIRAQIAELVPRAIKDFGLSEDTEPENDPVRVGEAKDGTPYRRLSFKMKNVKRVKGKEVKVKPRLVDAQKQPMSELIYGGSLVKVGYYIQATLVNGQFYCSVKLNAVQVLEHVGPGGEVSIDEMFDAEDGFTTAGADAPPTPTPDVPAADADDDVVFAATEY